jgi:hypothetical protein
VREELAKVNHEQVGIGCRRSDLCKPEHPCGLNAHQASEGNTGVKIRTPGLLKARGYLGEAAYDHAHSRTGRKYSVRTVITDKASYGGRKSKDATADDGVHNQRNQAPAADGADEFVARCADNSRFCHREFVPQTGAAWRESRDFAGDFAPGLDS